MESPAEIASELLEMIVCPACRAQLEVVSAVSLRCTGCGRVYPVVDGIPILLVQAEIAAS